MSSSKKLHVIAALGAPGVFNKKQKLQFCCFKMDKEVSFLKFIVFVLVVLQFQKLRTFFFHFGLLVFCIFYIFAGAAVFYWIEKPHEVALRNYTLEMVEVELATFLDVSFDILVQSKEGKSCFR